MGKDPWESHSLESRRPRLAALADRLLVAHAEPGGKTEQLCKAALDRGKRVFTLDSADNAHLLALGAAPFPEQPG